MEKRPVFRIFALTLILVFLFILTQSQNVQALLGDVDISGLVDMDDLAILDAAYSANDSSPNWDVRADINLDDYVNLKDLALAGRSYGETFNFLTHRRVSNGKNNNPSLTNPHWVDAKADSLGRVHVIWEEYQISADPLYYTQLDPAGNALIEDLLISTDSNYSRLDVGPDGSAHIIYQRSYSETGLYYTHISPDGSFPGGSTQILGEYSPSLSAITVDAYNHAHIAFRKSTVKAMYTIMDGANQLLPLSQLNVGTSKAVSSFALSVSEDGARHILWHQATSTPGGELRYTRISAAGEVTVNNLTAVALIDSYNQRHYTLATDSENAAHLLYYDFRESTPGIYWKRINADGSLSAERLISNDTASAAGTCVHFVIDALDQIHLIAPWTGTSGQFGYARLNRDGGLLMPFQRGLFKSEVDDAKITLDPSGQAMIVAPAYSGSPAPLFIVSTLPDPAAYDLNRADLVLDLAHLSVVNHLLKITESADISLTVTNGGPAPALGVNLRFTYLDVSGKNSYIDLAVSDLPAYTSADMHLTIPVPDFQEVDYWEVEVTASTSTPETSTHNNTINIPFQVIPPPKFFNLEVLPFDESYAPGEPDQAAPLDEARLELSCMPQLEHFQTIDIGDYFNVFWDIPLDIRPANAPLYPTTCSVTLTKEGYSSTVGSVTAQRFSEANPYAISLSVRPLKLYINTWGSIQGRVRDRLGNSIANAQLRLSNGSELHSGADGSFFFNQIPANFYTLRVWAAGFTPIPRDSCTVQQGKITEITITMDETKRAETFGIVRNERGIPLANVSLTLYEDSIQLRTISTYSDGFYTFVVDSFDDSATYSLVITRDQYETQNIILGDLTPGIPHEEDFTLIFNSTGGDLSTSGEITSWVQDERWCKAYGDDEDVPLKVKFLQKIGSKWCPSFQTVVNWGDFDYEFGLNYLDDADGKVVTEVLINFSNNLFISYDVKGGGWHYGGESRTVTAQRVDWIELIRLDSNGNPIGSPLWYDDTVRYSTLEADPQEVSWRIPIEQFTTDWDHTAIRVYYTIGQNLPSEENSFKTWMPPADLGLVGSGAPSGADRQVITWMLKSNTSSMRYSLADYRSFLHPPSSVLTQSDFLESWSGFEEPQENLIMDLGNLAVQAVTAGPAHVGSPYEVDLVVSGMDSRPVYALQFDLDFNGDYLRLIDVRPAPDFSGPYGSWHRNMDLSAINTAERLNKMAVVRLAATEGLSEGSIVRLVFMPIKKTNVGSTTKLDLTGTIDFADIKANLFDPVTITDLSIEIKDARVYLPLIVR